MPSCMNDEERDARRQAQEILRRIDADQQSVLLGKARDAREGLASHFAARDAAEDRTTLWAARIGRALGAIAFLLLVINLFTGWIF